MLKFARERTFGRHRPHFDLHTVRQARAFLRDSQRIIEAGDVQQKIAADRFLGFRKWAVRHHAVFARYDFAFGFEWVPGDGFALIRQPSETRPSIGLLLFVFPRARGSWSNRFRETAACIHSDFVCSYSVVDR